MFIRYFDIVLNVFDVLFWWVVVIILEGYCFSYCYCLNEEIEVNSRVEILFYVDFKVYVIKWESEWIKRLIVFYMLVRISGENVIIKKFKWMSMRRV